MRKLNKICFSIKAILKKGILFDKNNEPVIIDGIAQKDLVSEEELFWYGDCNSFVIKKLKEELESKLKGI